MPNTKKVDTMTTKPSTASNFQPSRAGISWPDDLVTDSAPPVDLGVPDEEWTEDIAEMGYMGGADHFNVQQTLGGSERIVSPHRKDQIANRPSEIPNRSLTDKLVHEYLNNFNYHYYCTYPPAFLRHYIEWWNATSSGQPVSKSFTALLLQILALAVQFLKEETRHQIEYELAESVQVLTEKYNAAADKLSQDVEPGQGGLHRVEQLFLAACWLKAEAKFVESWHAIGKTIREAQEQGLHQKEVPNSAVEVHEWHNALRRRMWCILYLWDWYMAGWLGRPFGIDHSKCYIDTNVLHISQSGTSPDPFTHISLQCNLIQVVARHYAKYSFKLGPAALLELQRIFDEWQKKLPDHLKLDGGNTSFDDQHSFVPSQRLQLHACVSVMRLNPLKAYLVNPVPPNSSPEEDQLRQSAVAYSLGLLAMSQTLFDLGVDAKDHLVAFCLFDTGALACSAIMHGVGKAVGRDEEIREAIDTTLVRLSDLARVSKPGAKSYRVLAHLVRRLPPASDRPSQADAGSSAKKIKIEVPSTASNSLPTQAPWSSSIGSHFSNGSGGSAQPPSSGASSSDSRSPHSDPDDALPWVVPNDGTQAYDTGPQLMPVAWTTQDRDFRNLDYGGFEQVWNWQNLNLDPYSGLPRIP
ncbi:hypothetical protein DV737_g4982, partial [Chaetothyriales sp. CBS 132003]